MKGSIILVTAGCSVRLVDFSTLICRGSRRCWMFNLGCGSRCWTTHDADNHQNGFNDGHSDYQHTRQTDAQHLIKRETPGTCERESKGYSQIDYRQLGSALSRPDWFAPVSLGRCHDHPPHRADGAK